MPVALHVGEGTFGPIDRNLVEVGRSQTRKLGIEIRKVAPVEQRIVRKINAGDEILCTKSDLLGFSEYVCWIAVQNHPADCAERYDFFRDQLGRVEMIKIELCCLFLTK